MQHQSSDNKSLYSFLSEIRGTDILVLFSSVCIFCLPLPSFSCDEITVKFWALYCRCELDKGF